MITNNKFFIHLFPRRRNQRNVLIFLVLFLFFFLFLLLILFIFIFFLFNFIFFLQILFVFYNQLLTINSNFLHHLLNLRYRFIEIFKPRNHLHLVPNLNPIRPSFRIQRNPCIQQILKQTILLNIRPPLQKITIIII